MNGKTKEMFEFELEAARKKLTKTGKTTSDILPASGASKLLSDFDLPYSTLPKIHRQKWVKTELFAC